jgi:hypothetical protein
MRPNLDLGPQPLFANATVNSQQMPAPNLFGRRAQNLAAGLRIATRSPNQGALNSFTMGTTAGARADAPDKQRTIKLKYRDYELLQLKIKKLQRQLINNKIFLNMVIHDMRNPTNSIEYGIKEVLKILAP